MTYQDERNVTQTQLAIVGDNHVHLLDSRQIGLSRNITPSGIANDWVRDGIFKALGKK